MYVSACVHTHGHTHRHTHTQIQEKSQHEDETERLMMVWDLSPEKVNAAFYQTGDAGTQVGVSWATSLSLPHSPSLALTLAVDVNVRRLVSTPWTRPGFWISAGVWTLESEAFVLCREILSRERWRKVGQSRGSWRWGDLHVEYWIEGLYNQGTGDQGTVDSFQKAGLDSGEITGWTGEGRLCSSDDLPHRESRRICSRTPRRHSLSVWWGPCMTRGSTWRPGIAVGKMETH